MNNNFNLTFDLQLLKTKSVSRSEIIEIAGKSMDSKGRENLDMLYDLLLNAMLDVKINTPLRVAHFLAQIMVESKYFSKLEEDLNYISYYKEHPLIAKKLNINARGKALSSEDQKKNANYMYSNNKKLGNKGGDDGWLYRGRGLMQLTGRSNYKQFSEYVNDKNIMNDPDSLVRLPEYSVKTATWYWATREGNYYADKDEFAQVTFKINGGFNGFDDRLKILTKSKIVLGVPLNLHKDLQYSRDKDAIANAYSYRKKDKGTELKSLFN